MSEHNSIQVINSRGVKVFDSADLPDLRGHYEVTFEGDKAVLTPWNPEDTKWIPITFSGDRHVLAHFDTINAIMDKWAKRMGLDGQFVPDDAETNPKWIRYWTEVEREFFADPANYKPDPEWRGGGNPPARPQFK
jgi:hypothetical protein